ncbi:inaC [Acrasis kona]|uniref:InaC n=1 Tax=Acrasis kona TaxID=1008807 RepID=A0AAW2YWA5_9EUKA
MAGSPLVKKFSFSKSSTSKTVSCQSIQSSMLSRDQLVSILRKEHKCLSLFLKRAEDLVSQDTNGFSDPFCECYVGDRMLRSSTKYKTLNPEWNEQFDFEIHDSDKRLIINCWDRDLLPFKRDFEGSVFLEDIHKLVRGQPTDFALELVGVNSGVIHFTLTAYNFGVTKSEIEPQKPVKNPKRERYVTIEHITSGGQATVYKVLDTVDETEKVMKQIVCQSADHATVALNEAWQVRDLKHNNMVQFDDLYLTEHKKSEEEKNYVVCFIMPFFKRGDLLQLIKAKSQTRTKSNYFPIVKIKKYLHQLAEGLAFLHSHFVTHRDIKPQNILVSDDYNQLKYCDFGLAKREEHKPMTPTTPGGNILHDLWDNGGTVEYMAPERLYKDLCNDDFSNCADVFALGIVIYEIITFRLNEKHAHPRIIEHQEHLEEVKRNITDAIGQRHGVVLADLVTSMMRFYPSERICASDVVEIVSSINID